jgi:hypothetical protein
MSLLLGMDPWVFSAWLLTMISAGFCVIYGIYYEYFRKQSKEEKQKTGKEEK